MSIKPSYLKKIGEEIVTIRKMANSNKKVQVMPITNLSLFVEFNEFIYSFSNIFI